MSNTIIELRHSYVSGNVPSSLANGEIAINTYDGKLFYRGGVSNTIQTIERYTGPAGLNGEIQFNDSGVLGANSGLSFNKTSGALTVSGNVTTSQYFIGDGSKLTGLAPALQIYSLANTASGVSNYMVLKSLAAYSVGTQNTTTRTVTTTPTLLTSFITDVGFPNITSIPSGDIVVEFDTQKASGAGGYYCYAEIYKRTVGGTETLIATTGNSPSSTLNSQIQQRVNHYVSTPIVLDVSDRIVVKIYAVMLTTSASISIYFDGAADGAFTLPTLPASTLNFVPYINATANIQLNSYSLIAQTVSANSVVVLGRDLNAYANAAFLRANNSLNANTGGNVTGDVTVVGELKGTTLKSTQSSGDEGGQLDLATAATNQSLSGGSVAIDIYQNKIRIFETGGTNRGVYIDLANGASAGVGTDLLNPTATPDTIARAQANAAFITANAAFIAANSAGVYANGAFTAANNAVNTNLTQNNSITAAFTAANSAGVYANGAFTRANNSLNANTGGTVTGSITADSFATTGSFGNISGANTIYANTFVANTGGYFQFADGSKQYTANAGSGGGTTDFGFGVIYTPNNSTYANATSANDTVTFVGESSVVVFANAVTKTITIAGTPGAQGLTVDYGFVTDPIYYSIDYGTL